MHTKCLGIVLIPCYLFLFSLFYYSFLLVYRFQSSFYSRFQTLNISTEHIFIWVVLRLDLNQLVRSLVSPPSFALCMCLSIFCKENSILVADCRAHDLCMHIHKYSVKIVHFYVIECKYASFLHSMCIYISSYLLPNLVLSFRSILRWFDLHLFSLISLCCVCFLEEIYSFWLSFLKRWLFRRLSSS